MATVLEIPAPVSFDEETLHKPTRHHSLLDKPRDMVSGLLDKAADSRKFHTAAALGTLAYWAYEAQASGYTKELTPALRHTIESGAHPVLGFVGAWLGYVAAKSLIKRGERREWKWTNKKSRSAITIGGLAVAGLAAGDFAGEMGQGIVTSTYFDFAHQKFETTKDAIAAAVGGIALGVSHRREKRKAKENLLS